MKPDKGNGVVILDRTVYDSSILDIISDSSKFKRLKNDPTLLREGQLKRFLRKLKKTLTRQKKCVVILDRTVYGNSILNIISDSSQFKKLKNDPTLLREGQLQRFLCNLKKNGEIDNIIYDKIYPSGSQPARIYRLPKMHKVQDHLSTPPFWPIFSSIGTYTPVITI